MRHPSIFAIAVSLSAAFTVVPPSDVLAKSQLSTPRPIPTGWVTTEGPPLIVAAPAGWTLDDRPGADGIPLVLYPAGGSFEKSAAVMYLRTFARKGDLTLDGFVRDDVARLRARARGCQVTTRAAVKLGGGARALLRDFANDAWGNCESVAYLESEEGFVTVVLNARDRKSHTASTTAFDEVVRKLRFIGDDRELRALVTAYRAADQNARTAAGESFEARVGEELAKAEGAALRECASRPDADRDDFDLVIRIGASGAVDEMLARPENRSAECLRSSIADLRLASPPRPSYWVRVRMSPAGGANIPPVADSSN